jgi:hypothetical protein
MRYWTRELLGWLLVLAGLGTFWPLFWLCQQHYVVEAWPVALFGIFVFRGGIHLLKVAVAARVCLEAQDRAYPAAALRPRPPAPPRAREGRTAAR